MNDAVLEIFGANGGLQVSGERIAFGLSGYGSVILTDDGQSHSLPIVTATVTVQGVNPVLAFRPQNERYVTVTFVAPVTGGYAFTLVCQSNVSVGLQYWSFDVAAKALLDPTMNHLSAAVWDASGVKTFDMAMASAMRVVAAPAFTLPAVTSPPPVGGSLIEQSQQVPVASGRTWAIVQATLAMGGDEFDTGVYSLQDNEPETGPVFGDSTPPAGAKWRYQQFRGFRSMAGFSSPEQVWVGFRKHEETFGRWVGIEVGAGYCRVGGNIDYLLVDVTDLPSASMPTPSDLSVAVSAPTREVSVGSNGAITTISPKVTATVSGGQAPYVLSWQFVEGSTAVIADGASDGLSFGTKVVNQQPGTTLEAKYRLRANDGSKLGFSQAVTFRHTVTTLDLTPDAISNIAAVSGSSNDPDVYFGYDYRRITGISGPITLRVERYDYSGDADIVEVLVATSPDAVNWTNLTPFNAKGTAQAYVDFNVANGTYVGWKVRVVTASGRKSANLRVVIWNLSDASGSVQINSTPGNALIVDSDDNFNIDQVPDAFTLPNQTVVTNEPSAYTSGAFFTINGITRPITLRFTRDSLVESGLVPTRRTVIGKSTNGGASWTESNLGAAAGQFVDLSASQGDQFFIKGYLVTDSGRGTASWRNIVTNQTTGQQLATTSVNMTVDDDNNYNVADVVPDAINPQPTTTTTPSNAAYNGGGSTFTITGINTQITLRFANTLTSTSGNVSSRQMIVGRTRAGSTQEWFISVPNGSVDVPTQNGDQFYVKGYLETSSGIASSQWTWTVRNQSNGGVQIGSTTVKITVDNDNNYNVADVVMDYIGLGNQNTTHGSANAFNAGFSFTVTGINSPITLRFNTGDLSTSGSPTKVEMVAGRTTSGYVEVFRSINGAAVEITANNGDQFFVKGYVESTPGVRTTVQWNWFLTNITANQFIGSASVKQTTNA